MARINRRHLLIGAAGSIAGSSLSFAQDRYPTKPIRMLVPWTAGTPADIAARTVADGLGAGLGQAVYVDNKNGAAGTVAVPEALRASADGYTIYVLASASLVSPVLYPASDINFVKQFDAVGQLEWSYNVLCVSPDKSYKTVADLVSAIRANPGKISYASGGNGTPPHLAGEMLNIEANLKTIHVPYAQMGQAATDVMTGLADFIFMGAAGSVPLIKGGRLRPLAVSASKRVAALPDVPTMAESGFPNFVIRPFDGLLVKKGTPPDIVNRINVQLNKVLSTSAVQERFAGIGMEVAPTTPQDFARLVESESARWIGLARQARLTIG